MKALTLHQPWASLVVLGEKRIETRSWATRHRGPMAIHASARIPPHALQFMRSNSAFRMAAARWPLDPRQLPLGAVLGIVRLLDCLPTEALGDGIDPGERSLGNYSPGRYAWRIEVVQAFDRPVAARGMLGLWNWEPPR